MSDNHYDEKHDRSSALRARLASVGIFLDDAPAQAKPVAPIAAPEPDRAEIARILRDLGAPERDIEWMAASCPGVPYALAYRPTIKGTL